MDDLQPSDSAPSPDPILDAGLPPEPRRGCFRRFLLLLVVLTLACAAAAVFGLGHITKWIASRTSFSADPTTVQKWVTDTPAIAGILPPGYEFAGAYRSAAGLPVKAFVIVPANAAPALNKDPQAALAMPSYPHPAFLVVTPLDATSDFPSAAREIKSRVISEWRPTETHNKIWIEGRETGVSLGRIANPSGGNYRFVSAESGNSLLFGTIPENEAGPIDTNVLAAYFGVPATSVSLAPPEPPAMVSARLLLSDDEAQRKKALMDISAANPLPPEVIPFLGSALADSTTPRSAAVKADVVATLGIVAKNYPEAMSPLTEALKDKSVRFEAVTALGSLGPSAAAAVPALKKIANDKKESKNVKQAASKALVSIQGRPLIKAPAKKKSAGKK